MRTQSSQYPGETAPKKLLEQVQRNGWFRQLAAKAERIKQLQTVFLQVAGQELAQHCQILELGNGHLNIAVSNANWATHVRYSTPELIKTLRLYPEFSDLKAIHCHIFPDPVQSQPAASMQPNPISTESAACIAEVAKGVKDVRLKNALLKLAGRR